MAEHAKSEGLWRFQAFNNLVDGVGRNAAYTAASMELVDSQLGVVNVSFPADPDRTIGQIIPSAVDNLPEVSPAADIHLWHDARLAPGHTFEGIVSATPAVDEQGVPGPGRYLAIDPEDGDGQHPIVTHLVSEEVARYPHPQGLSEDEADEVKLAAIERRPVNVGVLLALAQSYSSIIMHSYRDRLSGYAQFPGVDAGKLGLFGPCRSITITFNPQQGLRTAYDMTQPPIYPQAINTLSPEMRRYVYGQLNAES